jgi:hypothetical protein
LNEPDDDDDDETEAERLFSCLRLWGLAEFALDQCIAKIFRLHGKEIPDDSFPVTLERKLKFLRAAHSKIEQLREYDDVAEDIAKLFMREKALRNIIVHGMPIKSEPNGTVHFIFLNPDRKDRRYILRVVKKSDWDRLFETSIELFALLALQDVCLNHSPSKIESHDVLNRDNALALVDDIPGSRRVRELFREAISKWP